MLKGFIAAWGWKIAAVVGVALVAYVGFLKWDNARLDKKNTDLVLENKQLATDLATRDETIASLEERATKSKQIEADYEKIRKELKGKTNGPVADVLRHAVDAGLVR